jgi:hypothetical protein
MRKFVAVMLAIGLLLVGCGAPDTPPKPGLVTEAEEIVGLWSAGGAYIKFTEDGQQVTAWTRDMKRPTAIGEYWLEGGQFFEKELEVHNAPSCGEMVGIYELQLLDNGNLLFTIVEDECESRAEFHTWTTEYKRVE